MVFDQYKNELPDNCFLIFTTPNCPSCRELLINLKDVEATMPVYCLSGKKGREVGIRFNIFSAPTTIKLLNGVEDDRFMGSRNLAFIGEFFS